MAAPTLLSITGPDMQANGYSGTCASNGGWFMQVPGVIGPSGQPPQPPLAWVNCSQPMPGQAADVNDGNSKWYNEGWTYPGNVEWHHIGPTPNIIPNIGIPGTSINVSTALLDGTAGALSLLDVIAQFFATQGEHVLWVGIWQHASSAVLTSELGYEIEVLVGTGNATASPQVGTPLAAGQVLMTALIIFAAFVVLDGITGGHLSQAFSNAIDNVFHSAGEAVVPPIQAAFQGPFLLLLGGAGLVLAIAFLSKKEGLSGENLRVGREVVGGAGQTAGSLTSASTGVLGATSNLAATGASIARGGGGRAPAASSRRRRR